MPARSSASDQGPGAGARLRLLLWNAFPLLHGAMAVAVACAPGWSPSGRWLAAAAVLYLLPPLVARVVTARHRLAEGEHRFGSATFSAWWAVSCCQGLFNRFGLLEELLRLVPGLYSAWLRLWGARVGRLTYWAPRLRILDRSLLVVGDEVVFGTGVELASHLVVRSGPGMALVLGEIRIGDQAVIGGSSRLAPGVVVEAEEATRACAILPPFNRFVGGRRVRVLREVADG